jgi:hypothetical protein
MIEMKELFPEMEIVHHKRATRTDTKRILVIRDGPALRCRQDGCVTFGGLVQLAALAAGKFLVVDRNNVAFSRRCGGFRFFGHGNS